MKPYDSIPYQNQLILWQLKSRGVNPGGDSVWGGFETSSRSSWLAAGIPMLHEGPNGHARVNGSLPLCRIDRAPEIRE